MLSNIFTYDSLVCEYSPPPKGGGFRARTDHNVSSGSTYATCKRLRSCTGFINKASPRPAKASAPILTKTPLESSLEVTLQANLAGKLAFIKPVTTDTS